MSKKRIEVDIEWNDPKDFPEELGQNGFSVDVLVYCEPLDIHQIGWFEYKTHKWHFLCNEQHIVDFVWRYFNNKIDKYGK